MKNNECIHVSLVCFHKSNFQSQTACLYFSPYRILTTHNITGIHCHMFWCVSTALHTLWVYALKLKVRTTREAKSKLQVLLGQWNETAHCYITKEEFLAKHCNKCRYNIHADSFCIFDNSFLNYPYSQNKNPWWGILLLLRSMSLLQHSWRPASRECWFLSKTSSRPILNLALIYLYS